MEQYVVLFSGLLCDRAGKQNINCSALKPLEGKHQKQKKSC
jgi:hypothetical protein